MAITKAQLQAEIEALRHNNELLRTQNESLNTDANAYCAKIATLTSLLDKAEAKIREYEVALTNVNVAELKAKIETPARRVSQHAPSIKIFEFDPAMPGDFQRACKLAKEFKGVARRVQAQ